MRLVHKLLCSFIVIMFFAGMIFVIGCSSVPPREAGSSIPWAQPEPWENSGLKPGVGF